MMNKVYGVILGALLALFIAGANRADAAACNTGADINTLGTCDFGGLTFVFNPLSSQPAGVVANVFFGIGSTADDTWVTVRFQISGAQTGPGAGGDILIQYAVLGGINGVDMAIGTSSGVITITENVCAVSPCNAANTLFALVVDTNPITPNGPSGENIWGSPILQTAFISKDLSLSPSSSISDFENSHHRGKIPEPAAMVLFGVGLVGLGIWGRKRFEKK